MLVDLSKQQIELIIKGIEIPQHYSKPFVHSDDTKSKEYKLVQRLKKILKEGE